MNDMVPREGFEPPRAGFRPVALPPELPWDRCTGRRRRVVTTRRPGKPPPERTRACGGTRTLNHLMHSQSLHH